MRTFGRNLILASLAAVQSGCFFVVQLIGETPGPAAPLRISLSVAPLVAGKTSWFAHTASDGSDCTYAEAWTAGTPPCFPVGRGRKVEISNVSSCTGLTMTDAVGAFDWTCMSNTPGAGIAFVGSLKAEKGLNDLVDFTGAPVFYANSVTLAGTYSATSTSSVWWTDSFTALPDSSGSVQTIATGDTIYYSSAGATNQLGFNFTAGNVGLLIRRGYTLVGATNPANNCNEFTGSGTVGVDTRCFVTLYGQSSVWIEGTLQGSTTQAHNIAVHLGSTKYATLKNVSIDRFGSISLSGRYGAGIRLDNTEGARILNTRISRTRPGSLGGAPSPAAYGVLGTSTTNGLMVDGLNISNILGIGGSVGAPNPVGHGNAGGAGSTVYGISFSTLHYSTLKNILITALRGGNGGGGGNSTPAAGGFNAGAGANGGGVHGININTGTEVKILGVTVVNLKGGNGGNGGARSVGAGAGGAGGFGGGGAGITISAGQDLVLGSTLLASSDGGNGGNGGSATMGTGGNGGNSAGFVALSASSITRAFGFNNAVNASGTGGTPGSLGSGVPNGLPGAMAAAGPVGLNSITSGEAAGSINLAGSISVCGADGSWMVDSDCLVVGTGLSGVSSANFATPFGGIILVEDDANTSDLLGAATYAAGTDFTGFDSFFRAWGLTTVYPSPASNGAWSSGSGNIWDWRLAEVGSNPFLRTALDGATMEQAFTVGSTCPSASVSESAFVSTINFGSPIYTAVEALIHSAKPDGTWIGNGNGLCDEGELCEYFPNFGAYQGHGNRGECTPLQTTGKVSTTRFIGFESNGI